MRLITKQGLHPLLSLLCAPASSAYALATGIRRYAYQHHLLPSHRATVPVVSIGNITVGGTGKTPFIRAVASRLTEMGKRPAVISRGYRGTYTGVRAVSDPDHTILMQPHECGDEPWLLATQLPGVPVIVSRDRSAGARFAVKQYAPDLILLDDGMQHLALQRDLDIVLIDATNPFGNGYTLPSGILREPLSALRTAGAVVLTKTNQQPATDAITAHLNRLGLADRTYSAPFSTMTITDTQTQETKETTLFKDDNYICFSGLGNNDSFVNSCTTSIGAPTATILFSDHHAYSEQDITLLNRTATKHDATLMVTSTKDAARLHTAQFERPLHTLNLTMACPEPILDAITALL